jgi:DNA-binding MarR family transcriptional regulator
MCANTRFGYHFAKLHRIMLSLCKEDMEGLGIQLGQMPFLLALFHADDPLTQDALSAHLAIDKAATARALSQLEKKGLVSRSVNPLNRRQKYVSATAKAHGLAERMFSVLQTVSDTLTRGFSDEELTTVLNLMNRMIANATEEQQ